jgi:hypothetical protein
LTCSQASHVVGAAKASGVPRAIAGSRACGDWRKLVPNSAGSRSSNNYSRMVCTERLFAGLTLFISPHQRMSETKTKDVDPPPPSVQQLEIDVTLILPTVTVYHRRLADAIRLICSQAGVLHSISQAGRATHDTTHLPLLAPDSVPFWKTPCVQLH